MKRVCKNLISLLLLIALCFLGFGSLTQERSQRSDTSQKNQNTASKSYTDAEKAEIEYYSALANYKSALEYYEACSSLKILNDLVDKKENSAAEITYNLALNNLKIAQQRLDRAVERLKLFQDN